MIGFLTLYSLISLGLIHLACSMFKHQKQVFNRELSASQTRIAQYIGWLILVISLILAIWQRGTSVGISYWFGALTIAALIVAWFLSYQATHFKTLTISFISTFLLCSFIQLL
ncbi:uncharacterized protein DUF3325 [Acinetobacter calcoaceticus]|uniref:Uncharacterized protein DUF3325 n=1 Tax=Acinetobacter calcoaceticus TaxID=471 RepID=A0A4R1XNK5_ACICA|nr:uncharacterized protein DUF3325 [Acinetobacter calcoaceticus]